MLVRKYAAIHKKLVGPSFVVTIRREREQKKERAKVSSTLARASTWRRALAQK